LPAHRGDDEGIAQFFPLAIKRHHFGAGVVVVVILDGLLEKNPLGSGLLVPDDKFVRRLARAPASRQPCRGRDEEAAEDELARGHGRTLPSVAAPPPAKQARPFPC